MGASIKWAMAVAALAALLTSTLAGTSCGPCSCSDGDHWVTAWQGLKVAQCWGVQDLVTVPATLPADIQVLFITWNSIPILAERQFESYRYLQKIDISTNHINKVEQGALRDMTHLTYFSLFNNKITEVPSDLFTYSPNLTEVALNTNRIKRLQTNLFRNLIYLKNILLGGNEISSIEKHCFVNVPQLEQVSLTNNKLITLDENFIDKPISLKILYLNGNPWHCDAPLCGVMSSVVRGKLWADRDVPACATPRSLADKPWNETLQTGLCPNFTGRTGLSNFPSNSRLIYSSYNINIVTYVVEPANNSMRTADAAN